MNQLQSVKCFFVRTLCLLLLLAFTAVPAFAEDAGGEIPAETSAETSVTPPAQEPPAPTVYDYSLNLNGTVLTAQSAETSYTFDLGADPTLEGKIFKGWADANGVIAVNPGVCRYTVTADAPAVTLVPVWEDAAVSYSYSLTLAGYETLTAQSELLSHTFMWAADPILEGKIFKGWADAGGVIAVNPGVCAYTVTADSPAVTLTPVWEDAAVYTYSLTFADGETMTAGPTAETSHVFTWTDNPAETGKTFLGWSLTKGGAAVIGADARAYTVTADNPAVTLYPVWETIRYTVTYMDDGAVLKYGSYDAESGYTAETSFKDGYILHYWTVSGGNGWQTAVYPNDTVSGVTGDVTLTAVWKAAEYTIITDYSGGVISTESPEYFSGTAYTVETVITLPVPEKSGYNFDGWTVSYTDGIGEWYTEEIEATVGLLEKTPLPAGQWGNVTLTAKWVEDKVTLFYYVDGVGGTLSRDHEEIGALSGIPAGAASGAPSVEAIPDPGYVFAGWFVEKEGSLWPVEDGTDGESGVLNPQKDISGLYVHGTVYYAKFELQLGSLTVAASGVDEDQSLIFTVVLDPDAAELSEITLTVVIPAGESSVKICDLPVGTCTVTTQNGWSWRYDTAAAGEEGASAAENTAQTDRFTAVAFEKSRHLWLSGSGHMTLPRKRED